MPAVEFFRQSDYYSFLDINGEQSIEDVHQELVEKVKTEISI